MTFEACCEDNGSLKKYYLSDNSGRRSSITFIASTVLSQPVTMSTAGKNTGGWAQYPLNSYVNNRVYNALSENWRQLIKQVKVKSSIGLKSNDTSSSDCYVFIPAIAELYSSSEVNTEPYTSEGTHISHFPSNIARVCKTQDGVAVPYWTRSPSTSWDDYVYRIDASGEKQAVTSLSSASVYVRIMISI